MKIIAIKIFTGILLFFSFILKLKAQITYEPRKIECILFFESSKLNNDTLFYRDDFNILNQNFKIKNNTHFTDSIIMNDSIVLSTAFIHKNFISTHNCIALLDNNFNLKIIDSSSNVSSYSFHPGFKIIGKCNNSIYFSSGPMINILNDDTLICNSVLRYENGNFEIKKSKISGKKKSKRLKENVFMYSNEYLFISNTYQIICNSDINVLQNKLDSIITIFRKGKKYEIKAEKTDFLFSNLYEYDRKLFYYDEKRKILKVFSDGEFVILADLNEIENNTLIYDYKFRDGYFYALSNDRSFSLNPIVSTSKLMVVDLMVSTISIKFLKKTKL